MIPRNVQPKYTGKVLHFPIQFPDPHLYRHYPNFLCAVSGAVYSETWTEEEKFAESRPDLRYEICHIYNLYLHKKNWHVVHFTNNNQSSGGR